MAFCINGEFRSSKWTSRASKVAIFSIGLWKIKLDIENKYGQKQQTKVEVDFQKILIPFILLFSGWDYEVPGKDFNSIGSSRVYFEV